MIPHLQEPAMFNPFVDFAKEDSESGFVVFMHPDVAIDLKDDVVPRSVYDSDIADMGHQIAERDAEIAKLVAEIKSLRAGSAALNANAKGGRVPEGLQKYCSEVKQDLLREFGLDIAHADWSTNDYDCTLRLHVATVDGRNHNVVAPMLSGSNPAYFCEDSMRHFLHKQGYASRRDNECIRPRHIEKAKASLEQHRAVPPVSPGQPPQFNCLIGGSQIGKLYSPLEINNLSQSMNRQQAQTASAKIWQDKIDAQLSGAFFGRGVGIDKAWLDELDGTFLDGSKI